MSREKFLRFGTWLLVVALFLAQLLASMHRVSHGLGPAGHRMNVAAGAVQNTSAPAVPWIANLFAAHSRDGDCRLYDAHCHAATPPVILPVLSVVPALAFLSRFHSAIVAAALSPFEARGPPLSR